MTYWLDLFTIETWREFKEAGGTISGFRESRWSRVKRMKPGDRLLCYAVALKRWIAVLEVTSEPFFSSEPRIWESDDFPARVQVKVDLELGYGGHAGTQPGPLLGWQPRIRWCREHLFVGVNRRVNAVLQPGHLCMRLRERVDIKPESLDPQQANSLELPSV